MNGQLQQLDWLLQFFSTVVRKNPTTKSENFRYSPMYELCDNKDRKRLQIFVDGFGEADIGQSEEWKS